MKCCSRDAFFGSRPAKGWFGMKSRSKYLCVLSAAFALAFFGCGDESSASAPGFPASGDQPLSSETLGSCASVALSSDGAISSMDVPQSSSDGFPLSSGGVVQSSSGVFAVSSAMVPSSSSSEAFPQVSSDGRNQESSSGMHPDFSSSSVVPLSSAGEPALEFSFFNGADISTVQEYERFGAKFYDVDGTEADIFTVLKNHGFNAIRLRTFVSPTAKYGYAAQGCEHSAESYGDKEHVIAYAKKVKAAGMALLLDIHYSDNWADPGKQIIPERWRNVASSDAMADSVYAYTYDIVNALKQAGATPEMVQVGNETTPGILIHKPNSGTDCWGNGVDKASSAINGDMGTDAGKTNAAKYFNAGIKAVKDVSQNIKTVLHIESIHKTNTVDWWMGVIFDQKKIPADVMGFSAYTAYSNGGPDDWKRLFGTLGSKYPKLEFIVAEYNGGDKDKHYNFDGSRQKTVEMARTQDRVIGTFFWEPTLEGAWGTALFDWNGSNLKANSKAFEEYPRK